MKDMRKKINTLITSATAFAGSASAVYAADITPPSGFFGSITDVINKVLVFVMAIAALMVFLYLIWGGIDWISSGGDKGKVENARNKITSAVIGLIVLAAAYAILTIVLNFLGGNDLNTLLNNANIQ